MGRTRSEIDAALQALYDQIPAIPDCKGHCWISCGPLDMSDRERQRIREAGYRITPWHKALRAAGTFWCEALTAGGRCAVYDRRPLVCRLWGAVEGLKCPHGCRPEGGWLSDMDGYRLIAESMATGGGPGPDIAATEVIAEIERQMADPQMRAVLQAYTAKFRGDYLRLESHGTQLPPEIRNRRQLPRVARR